MLPPPATPSPITVPVKPEAAPVTPAPIAASIPRDVCANTEACARELDRLVSSRSREWIKTPATPTVYATGTRLFAFKILRPNLTCPEIVQAVSEISVADDTFAKPVTGVEVQQSQRILKLNADVARELKDEHAKRC